MALVISQDKRIVVNKFIKGLLFALLVWGITALANYIAGGGLPVEWGLFAPLIMSVLGTVKKALDIYKPEYADEFKWFYEAFIRFAELVISKFK